MAREIIRQPSCSTHARKRISGRPTRPFHGRLNMLLFSQQDLIKDGTIHFIINVVGEGTKVVFAYRSHKKKKKRRRKDRYRK